MSTALAPGLYQQTDRGTTFLLVKHHGIVEESKTEREGFTAIDVQNPRTGETIQKYVKRYGSVVGLIKKIEWYDTESKYENRYMGWRVTLDISEEQPVVLDLPFESRAASRFMRLAGNIDFAKLVEIQAWKSKDDSTAFNVKQDKKTVPQLYTRDNPNGCPDAKQRFGGKWDFSEQLEFLHGQMVSVVIPKLEAVLEDDDTPF